MAKSDVTRPAPGGPLDETAKCCLARHLALACETLQSLASYRGESDAARQMAYIAEAALVRVGALGKVPGVSP
jgi:hypothetical protein